LGRTSALALFLALKISLIYQTTTPIPENETSLIINDLNTKTHETTGNKPAIPATLIIVIMIVFNTMLSTSQPKTKYY
jgi:hypothetical protein